ncbi:reverse transcriptase domain-containing protein [Tanacetum coccineum]
MAKKDEEKTAFHTDEGVFCYTKMPFGLKNARAAYQRLVDTIFEGKMGRNLEAYVDDMVIKSKTELEMIKDVEETLLMLKRVNMKLNPKKCSFEIEEGKFLGYIVTSKGIRANPEKTKTVMNMPSPSNLKMQRLSGKRAALNRFLSKAAKRALPCLDTLKKCANKKDFQETEEAFQEMKKLIVELPTLTTPKKGEELMVYLSVANEAASVVLLVERNRGQTPIHYVSRTLHGAEINYPPMEKLALALVHVVRRLRRYFQGHTIKYTDGASNGYDSGVGLILIDPEGVEYSYALRLNFANSKNDAEYKALLAGLRIATKMKVKKMHAFVDSKLVASQVEGSYEAKGENTKKYKDKALEIIRNFSNIQISHIPREENKKADALSKLAAVQCEGLTKGVLIEELNERSVDMAKSMQ